MRDLQKYNWSENTLLDREIEVSAGQSMYVRKLIEIWQEGITAYLNMRLRNPESSQQAARILNRAIKYEFSELVLLLSVRLMKFYPYRGRKSDMARIQSIVKNIQSVISVETDAEFFLTDIDQDIISKLSNDRIREKLDKYINEIDPILQEYHSLNFILNAYTLKVRRAQLDNNVEEIISLCDEAMARFEEKTYELPHVVYLAFTFLSIPLHIENNNFDAAEKLIESMYKKLTRKTVNWFVVHSYDIILNFRKLDFERVGELLGQVKRYDNEINRERNKIYEAYLSLFTKQQFKLGKFSNEVFEHYKDRQGYRINIIIVQLLHLLKYRKHGVFIDRVEAIEKYLQRYLKSTSKKLLRSRYFLKCLLVIPKSNFNKIAFKRKSAPYFEKLIATKRSDTNQLLEQEPVTYEHLYFYVEGLLR